MKSLDTVVKVLVVDDRAEFCQLVAEILGPFGFQTCSCLDGGEVLEKFSQELPRWVVMDVRMRTVDGLTATRLLRERFPDAQVIVVSGFDPKGMEPAALAAGARAFLSKENLSALPALLQSSLR